MLTLISAVLGFVLAGPVGLILAPIAVVLLFGVADAADSADANKQKETNNAEAKSAAGGCFPVFLLLFLGACLLLVIMAPALIAPPDCQTIYLNQQMWRCS